VRESPTVNARLDDDLADLLEQLADREGAHKIDIVRRALRAYLPEHPRLPPPPSSQHHHRGASL
jgi:hypothetical protein